MIQPLLAGFDASCLFTFADFRSRARRRFVLLFCLVVFDSGTDEIFQRSLIDLVAVMNIDRTSHVAFEAGVEEA